MTQAADQLPQEPNSEPSGGTLDDLMTLGMAAGANAGDLVSQGRDIWKDTENRKYIAGAAAALALAGAVTAVLRVHRFATQGAPTAWRSLIHDSTMNMGEEDL